MSKFHRHSTTLVSHAESPPLNDNPLRRRIRPWVIVVLLFPILGTALVAGLYLSKPKVDKANETFALALDTYGAALLQGDAKEPSKDSKVVQYKTVQERADATLALLAQVEKQATTPALVQLAHMLRAQVWLSMGKAEETEKLLKTLPVGQFDATIQPLAWDLLALSQEERKQPQSALSIDQEQASKAPLYYQPLFRLAQARLLQAQGKNQAALELYRSLSTVTWSRPYADFIANRVVALEASKP